MPTTVSKTIGTGGDYSTLQSWEDAAPANLVTSDQVWQGLVKNETFSSATNLLTIAGSTSDSTRYKELTTDAGASFIDNIGSGDLRYNASNGAAISCTGGYAQAVTVTESYARMSKLQIQATATTTYGLHCTSGTNQDFNRLIVEGKFSTGIVELYDTKKLRNSLVVQRRSTTPTNIVRIRNGASAYNCTFVSTVAAATNGNTGLYSAPTFQNCGFFNVGTVSTGGTAPSFTTCYTDVGSPPSGCTTTAYATGSGAKFGSITDGSHNFRVTSGSSLIDVGTTDSTNAATDILGTSRPSGSSYDVGCFEYVAAGGYTLTAAGGSFSLTGNAAGLKANRRVTAAAGSFTLTGNAAGLYRGLRLSAAAGTYAWTGNAANLVAQRKLLAAAGSYVLTGNAAVLRLARMLAAASGTYTLTGNAADLIYSQPGSYSLAADPGAFTLTGQAAGLRADRRLPAAAGIFNLTGSVASLLKGYRLAATVQTYALTGQAATLSYSGASPSVSYASRTRLFVTGRELRVIGTQRILRSIRP